MTTISRIWPWSLCPRRLRSKPERAEASGIAAVPTARPLTCGFGTRPNGLPHDRQRERFYSPILLFESYAADLRLCASRRDLGRPPSAMRPWAPGSGTERSADRGRTGHGRARTGPRTATDQPTDDGGKGHGRGRWERYADRSHRDSRSDLPFQDACSASPWPSSPTPWPAGCMELTWRSRIWRRREVPDSVARKCARFGASERVNGQVLFHGHGQKAAAIRSR